MGRMRMVKPEFFQHEQLWEAEQACGLPLRLAFVGLWTQCDREGRFEWRPLRLKLGVMPWDNIDFGAVLDALATHGFLVKYTEGERTFGAILSWKKHQHPHQNELASVFPAPPGTPKEESLGKISPTVSTVGESTSSNGRSASTKGTTASSDGGTARAESEYKSESEKKPTRPRDATTPVRVATPPGEEICFLDSSGKIKEEPPPVPSPPSGVSAALSPGDPKQSYADPDAIRSGRTAVCDYAHLVPVLDRIVGHYQKTTKTAYRQGGGREAVLQLLLMGQTEEQLVLATKVYGRHCDRTGLLPKSRCRASRFFASDGDWRDCLDEAMRSANSGESASSDKYPTVPQKPKGAVPLSQWPDMTEMLNQREAARKAAAASLETRSASETAHKEPSGDDRGLAVPIIPNTEVA